MDIAEIRKEKEDLELCIAQEISSLVNDFQSRTKVDVRGVSVDINVYRTDEGKSTSVVSGVTADLILW